MKKLFGVFMLILIVLTMLFLTSFTTTDGLESKNITVFITDFGECYHTIDCKEEVLPTYGISIKEAIDRGYSPCIVCNPLKLSNNDTNSFFNINNIILIIILSLFAILLIIIIILLILLIRINRKNITATDTKQNEAKKVFSNCIHRIMLKKTHKQKEPKHKQKKLKQDKKSKKSFYYFKVIIVWGLCLALPSVIYNIIKTAFSNTQIESSTYNSQIESATFGGLLMGILTFVLYGIFISLAIAFSTEAYKKHIELKKTNYINKEVEITKEGSWICPACKTSNLYRTKCENCGFEPVLITQKAMEKDKNKL